MRADPKTEHEIMAVLEHFRNTVAQRNMQGVIALFSTDPDIFILGSEENELARGPDQLRKFFERIFSRPVTYNFEWKSYAVSVADYVAWVAINALVRVKGNGRDTSSPYRITAVLEKRNDMWLLMHYHGSEPVSA